MSTEPKPESPAELVARREGGEVIAALPEKLVGYINTRDRRASTVFGYPKTPHAEAMGRLLRGNVVRIGGRASCGSRVDPSWVEFTDWNAIVRKARSLGLAIEETPVKHGNGWATKAGGFWHENDYRLHQGATNG